MEARPLSVYHTYQIIELWNLILILEDSIEVVLFEDLCSTHQSLQR